MNNKIFIPVVGEFANVGDVMHRNELLKWIQPCGRLYVYVGQAPDDFIQGLELPKNSVIYTSLTSWLFALLFAPFRKTHFVFNSGELTVSNRRLLMEIILFPFLLLTKLKGGKIVRVGVAAASNVKVQFKSLWRSIFNFSTLIMWRTTDSRELFKKGEVIPDLAFAGKDPDGNGNGLTANSKYLIVSMRWDRPYPYEQWIKAVKDFSIRHNLKILVVSQVRKDNETCVKIAKELEGEVVVWKETVSHLEQERYLRQVYRESRLCLSDRLHVLIAAITEGVLPSVVLTKPSDKVQHHFDVLGMSNISTNTQNLEEIGDFLDGQIKRQEEVFEKLKVGQSVLKNARERVQKILTA